MATKGDDFEKTGAAGGPKFHKIRIVGPLPDLSLPRVGADTSTGVVSADPHLEERQEPREV